MALRICQLSHVEATYNFLAPLCHALRAEGHDVVASCTLDRGGEEIARYLGPGFTTHRVSVGRSVGPRELSVDVARLAAYFRRERFDVVHTHSPVVSAQARVAARIARVPVVVYQAHGFHFHDGTTPFRRHLLTTVEAQLGRRFTDYLVTVNHEDHRLAYERGFLRDARKLTCLPGVGVDVDRFRPPTTAEDGERQRRRLAHGATAEQTVVLFVGRLVAEKGILDLLDAVSLLRRRDADVRLWVVGEGLAGERDVVTAPEVLRRVNAPSLTGVVELLGRREDIPELMRAADVFVLPSYREGMPVALLEAMASGLPVVATDIRGSREAVTADTGLLVQPGDPAGLAAALGRLGPDADLRAVLGANARERARAQFSTARSLQPQLEMYERICADLAG